MCRLVSILKHYGFIIVIAVVIVVRLKPMFALHELMKSASQTTTTATTTNIKRKRNKRNI